jgi:hypothetical protein
VKFSEQIGGSGVDDGWHGSGRIPGG